MEGKKNFLIFFTNPKSVIYLKWGASSLQALISLHWDVSCAHQLQKLTQEFIESQKVLPINPYCDWNLTILADEDLAFNISLYLQELGKDITAGKIVEFLVCPKIKFKHGIMKIFFVHCQEVFEASWLPLDHSKEGTMCRSP